VGGPLKLIPKWTGFLRTGRLVDLVVQLPAFQFVAHPPLESGPLFVQDALPLRMLRVRVCTPVMPKK
jgi:hypothetical protein